MRRVVDTSRGLISVDLEPDQRLGPMRLGLGATVAVFDSDGWQIRARMWLPDHADSSLGEFLASYVGLPRDEAETLATEIQDAWIDEWRARGGEDDEREFRRFTNLFLVAVAVVVAFAIAGVVLAVWFLAT